MGVRRRSHHRPRFRAAVLIGVGLVVGMMMITPAGAALPDSFHKLWKDFIKPKLATPGTINVAKNPVDWTKLKGVPGGFADGVDDTGGAPGPATDVACTGCVTSSDLGTITVRTATALVVGGGAENGAYVENSASRYCLAGEEAISWGVFWDASDLNGAAPGGGDDLELTISSVVFDIDADGNQGYIAWAGNDSGVDHTMTLQVRCLAG